MFGVAEVVALAGSCFVLALVLFSYLYFLVPARSRISSLNTDRKQIETNIKTLETVVNKEHGSQQTVDSVVASLNDFETKHLLRQDQGRLQLYEELNQLIIKNRRAKHLGPDIHHARSQRREGSFRKIGSHEVAEFLSGN